MDCSIDVSSEQKEIVEKFHDDLGKLVFEATKKIPTQRVVSELKGLKILLEVQYVINIMNQIKASGNKDIFDKMYG